MSLHGTGRRVSLFRHSARSLAAVALLLPFLSDPAGARLRDARLLLRWTTSPFPGAVVELVPPGGDVQSEPVPGSPRGEHLFDGLTSGLCLVELRDENGRLLRSWPVHLASELTTVALLDSGAPSLAVSTQHPDPFGNVLVWSGGDLSTLPGRGLEGFFDLAPPGPSRSMLLNGDSYGPVSRLRLPAYGLTRDAVGAQVPLGAAPAFPSGGAASVATDRYGRTAASVLASAASGGLTQGKVELHLRQTGFPLGPVEIEGAFQGLTSDDAGPLGVSQGTLPENDLKGAETRWTAFLRPASLGLLRLGFHAAGQSRRHYLHEFRRDVAHNPREDRSVLLGSGDWEFPAGPAAVSLGASYTRSYNETGDGRAFDRISNYNVGSIENDAVAGDEYDLYWFGGPGSSSRKPHLYNYYTQDLVSSWQLRGEVGVTPFAGAPLRAGIESRRTTWRWYEHLDPIVDSTIPPSAPTGYQYASYLGYSRDAMEHEDLPGHEAPQPRETVLWADQALPLGGAKLEGGLRWSSLAVDQRPLRSLDDPLGADSVLTEDDLRGAPTRSYADPSLGLHLPLGENTHLWADAGRRHDLPPLEMLYVSRNVLVQLESLARESSLKSSRDLIVGNPAVQPERSTTASLALGRDLAPGWSLRLTARMERTADTWVARRHSAGGGPSGDSVAFFENRGERRERALRLDLAARLWENTRLRGSYTLGSRETNVIEPAPLYRALILPDAPAEGTGSRETAPLVPRWFDDGIDRDWFPSILDRTHRITLAWMTGLGRATEGTAAGSLLGDLDLALVLRAASGAPYTPVYVRQEGSMTGAGESPALTPGNPTDPNGNGRLDASEIGSRRMPWSWQADIGLRRPFRLFRQRLAIDFEVRNVLNRKNPRLVYGASGELDDDGWLDSTQGRAYLRSLGANANRFRDAYEERLDNPNRYEGGRAARAGLSWEL